MGKSVHDREAIRDANIAQYTWLVKICNRKKLSQCNPPLPYLGCSLALVAMTVGLPSIYTYIAVQLHFKCRVVNFELLMKHTF